MFIQDFTGFFRATSVFELVIRTAISLLVIAGQWRIFEKAGEPGWKSLIPIYNTYILYKITWSTQIFWITLALGLFSAIVPILGVIAIIPIFFISLVSVFKLSYVFGHNLAYAIGLFFLRPLFIIILGFGPSKYFGPER